MMTKLKKSYSLKRQKALMIGKSTIAKSPYAQELYSKAASSIGVKGSARKLPVYSRKSSTKEQDSLRELNFKEETEIQPEEDESSAEFLTSDDESSEYYPTQGEGNLSVLYDASPILCRSSSRVNRSSSIKRLIGTEQLGLTGVSRHRRLKRFSGGNYDPPGKDSTQRSATKQIQMKGNERMNQKKNNMYQSATPLLSILDDSPDKEASSRKEKNATNHQPKMKESNHSKQESFDVGKDFFIEKSGAAPSLSLLYNASANEANPKEEPNDTTSKSKAKEKCKKRQSNQMDHEIVLKKQIGDPLLLSLLDSYSGDEANVFRPNGCKKRQRNQMDHEIVLKKQIGDPMLSLLDSYSDDEANVFRPNGCRVKRSRIECNVSSKKLQVEENFPNEVSPANMYRSVHRNDTTCVRNSKKVSRLNSASFNVRKSGLDYVQDEEEVDYHIDTTTPMKSKAPFDAVRVHNSSSPFATNDIENADKKSTDFVELNTRFISTMDYRMLFAKIWGLNVNDQSQRRTSESKILSDVTVGSRKIESVSGARKMVSKIEADQVRYHDHENNFLSTIIITLEEKVQELDIVMNEMKSLTRRAKSFLSGGKILMDI